MKRRRKPKPQPTTTVRLGRVLRGEYGTATEVIPTSVTTVDETATLAAWFLVCPMQSPAWDSYVLAVVHLRDIEGQEHPPRLTVPRATHELMVYACNPAAHPRAHDPETWAPLNPLNVVEQVELPDDAAGVSLAEQAAWAVVRGYLPAEPPFSDSREPWLSSMVKTAAHLRGEEHAP